ncbi:hypothetical protein PVT67_17975 [Gallaecimonas kandeliae]|uniref:hypothetical protein n=1 Tax=Gallaecimonas kandeliae TaxID=3029055 RepID=UPI002648AC1A|nr:hypothetical protein [Gallaecimonas kandeliae]WKE65530.1 hypothetical protein PVT67_17975 [Gallaecimonas kandeliae]
MKMLKTLVLALVLAGWAGLAQARLEPYKDYDVSDAVSSVTTVKVDPNMMDVYLEGLRDSWVAANKVAKEMGYIKDFKIYISDLPLSGNFNLALVIYYDKAADLEPNKEKYMKFMQKWGEEREKKSNAIAKTYPDVRTITGEYRMRELTLK